MSCLGVRPALERPPGQLLPSEWVLLPPSTPGLQPSGERGPGAPHTRRAYESPIDLHLPFNKELELMVG